jgi:hypothetical protein
MEDNPLFADGEAAFLPLCPCGSTTMRQNAAGAAMECSACGGPIECVNMLGAGTCLMAPPGAGPIFVGVDWIRVDWIRQ